MKFRSARRTSEDFMEEIWNDRTHVEQKRFLLFVCVSCISFALLVPQMASAQGIGDLFAVSFGTATPPVGEAMTNPAIVAGETTSLVPSNTNAVEPQNPPDASQCLPHCWERTSKDINANDGVQLENIAEEQDCKDACFNNEACIGTYWGTDPTLMKNSCWLQLPYYVNSVVLKDAVHSKLTACSDNCFPYCWKPKLVHVQTPGGVFGYFFTEDSCRMACTKDQECNGVDFNFTSNLCWLLNTNNLTRKGTLDLIHHWEITRNLPLICDKEELTTVPVTAAALPAGEPATSPSVEPVTNPPVEPVTNPAPVAQETASPVPPTAIPVEANITPGAGPKVGESSLNNGSAAGSRGNGGPSVGESNIGNGPAPARGPIGARAKLRKCPSHLKGIIAIAVLMGVCVMIIIGLIAWIVSIRREQGYTDSVYALSNDSRRGYQSIGTGRGTAESF